MKYLALALTYFNLGLPVVSQGFNIDDIAIDNRILKQTCDCDYYEIDVMYEEGKEGPEEISLCNVNGRMTEIVGLINDDKKIN